MINADLRFIDDLAASIGGYGGAPGVETAVSIRLDTHLSSSRQGCVAAICVVSSSVAADEVLALAVLAGQSRDGSSTSTPKSRVQRHLRLPANWGKKWVSLFPFVPS
jgi:hypothetical protein